MHIGAEAPARFDYGDATLAWRAVLGVAFIVLTLGSLELADGKIEVLTASGPDQISGTNDDSGHGLFTYHLLKGLNGAAEDAQGRVTLKSLYAYLRPKVMDDAHRANREQTPQLQSGGGDGADVVLRQK